MVTVVTIVNIEQRRQLNLETYKNISAFMICLFDNVSKHLKNTGCTATKIH